MTYQLVLQAAGASGSEQVVGGEKNTGDNIFAADLPSQYPCYAFYYPGPMPNPDLEQALRTLGDQTGQNLFVNIGRLNDPAYGKIARLFEIEQTPVIVLTAIAPLTAPEGIDLNIYVRLDSTSLLESPQRTMQCIHEVFTLFLRGEVAKAIATAKQTQRSELLRIVGSYVRSALGSVWEFISERDVSISVFEGRFELKRSSD
jgi:hypothetical protein